MRSEPNTGKGDNMRVKVGDLRAKLEGHDLNRCVYQVTDEYAPNGHVTFKNLADAVRMYNTLVDEGSPVEIVAAFIVKKPLRELAPLLLDGGDWRSGVVLLSRNTFIVKKGG